MNSTIIPKKKICFNCGKKDYIFSKGMCKKCATIKSTQKRLDRFQDEQEEESIKNLVEDLDSIFSVYIRTRYANENGIVQCYTCPKKDHWKQMQNGHYVSRYNYSTRWESENCRVQCPNCNSNHEVHPEIFANKLEQEKKGITDYLSELSRQIYKPTREELKGMIIEYRSKVNLIKTKFK
jgi:hypothetical protein